MECTEKAPKGASARELMWMHKCLIKHWLCLELGSRNFAIGILRLYSTSTHFTRSLKSLGAKVVAESGVFKKTFA